MNAVEIKNLSKKFKGKIAVNNLNLEIKEGELFSLLGVNGAGKTTTIRMLSCLLKPSGGDTLLLGDSIINNKNNVKEKINLSPQETAIAENLSVEENLEMISRIYGYDKNTSKEKCQEMINTFNLQEFKNSKAKTLSGGTKRRLSIAMALISEPKILFLDEPTLGLDVISRRELWSVINKLKGKITVILTTHYMEEAEQLSDRIGIMVKGNLKTVGTPKELIKLTHANNFEEAFVSLASEVI